MLNCICLAQSIRRVIWFIVPRGELLLGHHHRLTHLVPHPAVLDLHLVPAVQLDQVVLDPAPQPAVPHLVLDLHLVPAVRVVLAMRLVQLLHLALLILQQVHDLLILLVLQLSD
jgi:hypothetical protein